MTSTHRLTGVLLLSALTAMVAGAAVAVPSGLTLNPAEPAAALAAIRDRTAAHLVELGLDVVGWTALLAAGLTMAVRASAVLPAGLLAGAGLAGLLHDAGNLALTQLAVDPAAAPVAVAVMLTAKWTVNLAGLLWVTATAAAVRCLPLTAGLRRAGVLAALSGLASVALPWTTGLDGPTVAAEQVGYALHLPVLLWYGALGWRELRSGRHNGGVGRASNG